MKNKILVLGKGFIGTKLQEAFQCPLSAKFIQSFKDVQGEINKYRPKILINCIGHTGGRNVDDCERDKDKTLFANTYVPLLLGEVALRNRIKLVHISSGCIYHFNYAKTSPIIEEEIPDFLDLYYSRTKIYAENGLKALFKDCDILILRIRIPLDNRPHPRNILTKLTNFKKVIDLPNSLTYIPDFIKALKHLLRIDARGIYHVVNKGGLRYPDLLDVYKKYVPDFHYEIIDHKKLNLVRTNLLMSVNKLEKSGFPVRNIKEVLEECVKGYVGF
ncbi:MAG: hypothetical protein AMJ95_03445 [Omnitrophica WOR_2 bacterium SM23_72]|nr:MAG: hypothetical protein AMJ95_03445 [Omnitrophica WOR_2 bacterium SM23_72]